VQCQNFTAATPQITSDCQASRAGNDIEHLEYHGALFLLGKLRQEEITIWLGTATAHQHDVEIDSRNIVQAMGHDGTCSESIT
jgi:hypothetical protein